MKPLLKEKTNMELLKESYQQGGWLELITVLGITAVIVCGVMFLSVAIVGLVITFWTLIVYAIWGLLFAGSLVTLTPNWIGSFALGSIIWLLLGYFSPSQKQNK